MKKPEYIKEAKEIGDDSWDLSQFLDLPKNASKKQQIEALKSEAKWMEDHINTIVYRIDQLCLKIEDS